jgi:hypothetical protein
MRPVRSLRLTRTTVRVLRSIEMQAVTGGGPQAVSSALPEHGCRKPPGDVITGDIDLLPVP